MIGFWALPSLLLNIKILFIAKVHSFLAKIFDAVVVEMDTVAVVKLAAEIFVRGFILLLRLTLLLMRVNLLRRILTKVNLCPMITTVKEKNTAIRLIYLSRS